MSSRRTARLTVQGASREIEQLHSKCSSIVRVWPTPQFHSGFESYRRGAESFRAHPLARMRVDCPHQVNNLQTNMEKLESYTKKALHKFQNKYLVAISHFKAEIAEKKEKIYYLEVRTYVARFSAGRSKHDRFYAVACGCQDDHVVDPAGSVCRRSKATAVV